MYQDIYQLYYENEIGIATEGLKDRLRETGRTIKQKILSALANLCEFAEKLFMGNKILGLGKKSIALIGFANTISALQLVDDIDQNVIEQNIAAMKKYIAPNISSFEDYSSEEWNAAKDKFLAEVEEECGEVEYFRNGLASRDENGVKQKKTLQSYDKLPGKNVIRILYRMKDIMRKFNITDENREQIQPILDSYQFIIRGIRLILNSAKRAPEKGTIFDTENDVLDEEK